MLRNQFKMCVKFLQMYKSWENSVSNLRSPTFRPAGSLSSRSWLPVNLFCKGLSTNLLHRVNTDTNWPWTDISVTFCKWGLMLLNLVVQMTLQIGYILDCGKFFIYIGLSETVEQSDSLTNETGTALEERWSTETR